MAAKPVHLTPHEFDLLRVLAQNEGKLLTHRALLREVWGPGLLGRRTSCTSTSRSSAARSSRTARSPRYLLTEPGAGYRLVDPT